MGTDLDLKSTVNLPKTGLPMKANLPQTEIKWLEEWRREELYEALRAARRGSELCVLHDGPPYANGHLHLGTALNKVLKDIVVRSLNMSGLNSPYVPGWDCHGLPIELKVDRELGSSKSDLSPVSFRQACRSYAKEWVDIQSREFQRLGVLGDWSNPYLTMAPAYQAAIVRELATCLERGFVYRAKKAVHWCISCQTALAEAEVEYDPEHRSASIDVKFPLGADSVEQLVSRFPELSGKEIFAVIWTTTPWTLPANLALAFHPEADYGFFPVSGTSQVLILATQLQSGSLQRWHKSADGIGAIELGPPLRQVPGAELEGLRFRHPWIDRDSPAVLADYVTLDTGTGVVHTAPGHGWDDYLTGIRYGLDIYCPVDAGGHFASDVEHVAGLTVFDADDKVVGLLKARGSLLARASVVHSYPTCWRCHNPIIFRATEQWFISLDHAHLRTHALDAIRDVKWHPRWGQERIHNMIAHRPDWCISRQRLWGVPIPAFRCAKCNHVSLTAEMASHVAAIFADDAGGADAWYARETSALLPPGFLCPQCNGGSFEKEGDILDVWFDSGCSHAAVLSVRNDLRWPADIYLEGSDQYRGWFHSSLLLAVATRDQPPYREVITHGFTVDAKGHKMSKSVGNVVESETVVNASGADVLRLWVVMLDYTEDMRYSEETLTRLGEAYRKIRNTLRYLVSSLGDFDPKVDTVDEPSMTELDRYALGKHGQFVAKVRDAYRNHEFHVVYQQLIQYCSVDLSSLYFDVLKDRMYCELPGSPLRRSAQSALYGIVTDLCRLLAPIIPFTAEEVWRWIPGVDERSVHVALFPEARRIDDTFLASWQDLLSVRTAVFKALEDARSRKEITSSTQAEVTVDADPRLFRRLQEYESGGRAFPSPLASLFIVSRVVVNQANGPLAVIVRRTGAKKCERCWNYTHDVGAFDVDHRVCGRCATVLSSLLTSGSALPSST